MQRKSGGGRGRPRKGPFELPKPAAPVVSASSSSNDVAINAATVTPTDGVTAQADQVSASSIVQ